MAEDGKGERNAVTPELWGRLALGERILGKGG